jgi:hypothetical protein
MFTIYFLITILHHLFLCVQRLFLVIVFIIYDTSVKEPIKIPTGNDVFHILSLTLYLPSLYTFISFPLFSHSPFPFLSFVCPIIIPLALSSFTLSLSYFHLLPPLPCVCFPFLSFICPSTIPLPISSFPLFLLHLYLLQTK